MSQALFLTLGDTKGCIFSCLHATEDPPPPTPGALYMLSTLGDKTRRALTQGQRLRKY